MLVSYSYGIFSYALLLTFFNLLYNIYEAMLNAKLNVKWPPTITHPGTDRADFTYYR